MRKGIEPASAVCRARACRFGPRRGLVCRRFRRRSESEGLDQNELDTDLIDVGFDLQSSALDDSDTGFGATLGYQVNENFAAELSYVDLGEVSYQATNGHANPANESAALETSAAGPVFSLLGILPVGERFEVYGRAGLALMDSEGEATITIGDVPTRSAIRPRARTRWSAWAASSTSVTGSASGSNGTTTWTSAARKSWARATSTCSRSACATTSADREI